MSAQYDRERIRVAPYAEPGFGGVHVFAPDGARLGSIPTTQVVSNCCFGLPEMKRLFLAATKCLYAIDLE